jgi:enoyl-CoA hydratase/carnithine racemase|tara:strand:+ start:1381 stop:2166 length:786 start_codon:yes stop_codon:yes gene_type:complete
MTINNTEFQTILVEEDNYKLNVTLNRPDKKNAINSVMTNELLFLLDYASKNNSVRVIQISANGDVFCAGGDLRSMSGQENNSIPNMNGSLADIVKMMRSICKPIVCKIEGSVFAGALLLVCNATHAYAVDTVKFSTPEIKRGIWPFMVMAGLFRTMNKRQGLDLIMRGEPLTAVEAENAGLINKVFLKKDICDYVDKIVTELSLLPPKTMKTGLSAYYDQEFREFNSALDILEKEISKSLTSEEASEGITAFLEKRDPKWD